jgi:hypothetical protein
MVNLPRRLLLFPMNGNNFGGRIVATFAGFLFETINGDDGFLGVKIALLKSGKSS